MFITIVRTIVLYILVIFAIRIMGKRQIGDMQPGELVITILISEIAAIPIQDLNQPIITGVIAVFTLVFLEIFISVLAMKSIHIRRFMYGDSAIIIKNGTIDQKALSKLRVTGPDLLEVLRNQQIFDISEVAYAILETNGQLSVMLKPEYQNATVKDLKSTATQDTSAMQDLIISDGKFINDSIKKTGLSKQLINNKLKALDLNVKSVFIMTCDENMKFNIIPKDKK